MSVVIETTIGDITVDLYVKERPNACLNFLKLCKIKFYNLCVFYKIEKNFIAQTGDPTATGRGGESIFCRLYGEQAKYFDAEFKPRLKHEKVGTLSMVNNGNNMNGSQFFITLSENLTYLDENHSVFGEVAEGFDVLLKLNDAICDGNNRPYQDIRITHTVILHDPFEDPKGLEIPDASPEPTKEMLESDYIGADEEIDDTKGKTAEEVEEKIKESEAKARATILEMVGDIPDAEVKPPENVLFVCKLNPVTTSEDLEVIFSRFGKILSCEVIKDKKTGESLQYAFIEFEKEEDCEAAYFKMDNVLIDDRRIHVDFSQSVSKLYFNRNNASSKKQHKSNFMLKTSDKNDGYDLIFDDENDNDAANISSHKSKRNALTSKQKSPSKKRKHSSSYDDHEDKRKMRVEREEHSHSYKDSKNYKFDSEREKYNYKEKHREYSKNDSSYEFERSKSYKLKDDRYSYYNKHKEPKEDRSERSNKTYDKRYKDDEYSYAGKKSYDYKSKNKYSSDDLSRNSRDSKTYRKSPDSSHIRDYKSSHEKVRNKSLSPEHSKKSYKNKEHSSKYFSDTKHSSRSDSEKYIDRNKTSSSKSKNIEKETMKSASHKQKKNIKHSSNKTKSKTSRSVSCSSSTSSSSSSSSSLSSSSSSSSNDVSDQSPVSSHSKHRVQQKKYHDSSKRTKSHKKKRH